MQGIMAKAARGLAKALFAVLSVAVAGYAFSYLYQAFRVDDPFAAQFAVSGVDVPLHFFLAGLALLLGPLQLSGALRRRWPAAHRLCGWLYAGALLVASGSALSLALHAQGGVVARAGFVVLALLWPCVTAIGIARAVAHDFEGHRRWMCRSVALTFAAVTLRVMLGLGAGALELPFMAVYAASAWLSWLINLVVCEALLRWPAVRARRAAARVSSRAFSAKPVASPRRPRAAAGSRSASVPADA